MANKANDLKPGDLFADHYRVEEILDSASLSLLFKALSTKDNKPVTIRLLLIRVPGLSFNLENFKKTAAKKAKVTGPNLSPILEFGVSETNEPFVVTEFVAGKSLYQLLNRQGRLELEKALSIFVNICQSLETLHAAGLTHLSLKPNDIIIQEDGAATLIEYGLDKPLLNNDFDLEQFKTADENALRIATMYLSPEQCSHTHTDERSDIYAMGCIMYEALTGLPPFLHKQPYEIVKMHLNEEPRPLRMARNDLNFPLELDLLVLKTLRKSASQRQQTFTDLKDDLNHLLSTIKTIDMITAPAPTSTTKTAGQSSSLISMAGKMKLLLPIIVGALVLSVSALFTIDLARQKQQLQSRSPTNAEALWQELDTNGQKAFEHGDFKQAEINYEKALRLAESFADGDRRLLINLRKLQDIYTAETKYTEADQVEQRIKELLSGR
ncbi:MAG: serine/threonine protein kinase [Candidatus Obscuribacterales bacterium]|jgi:serine/threonine protein kinase|nr:serine/threonine protein kinase [Candidatus Obscuribacterales bacterium]